MKSINSAILVVRGARQELLPNLLVVGLLAFVLLASSCSQISEPPNQPPDASTPRLGGSQKVPQVDDAEIKELLKPQGKPRLVNFWATWCGPCREEFPDLVKIDGEYRGKIDFITITLDFVEEIDTTVPAFLTEMNAEMPTYLLVSEDENAFIASIGENWSGALPFTILYNQNGRVAFSREGKVDHQTLKLEIEKALSNN